MRFDPQYEYRAFFSRHHRREVGSSWYAAHPYSINDQPQGAQRAAPCLEEYGEEVLGDVLGLSREEIDEAIRVGAPEVPAAP